MKCVVILNRFFIWFFCINDLLIVFFFQFYNKVYCIVQFDVLLFLFVFVEFNGIKFKMGIDRVEDKMVWVLL